MLNRCDCYLFNSGAGNENKGYTVIGSKKQLLGGLAASKINMKVKF